MVNESKILLWSSSTLKNIQLAQNAVFEFSCKKNRETNKVLEFPKELNCSIALVYTQHMIIFIFQVNHSQRCNDTPLKTWILAQRDGDVLFGHCNCMAGLCEACSHVGAILFACETAARIHNSRTCTQDQNKWLVPSHVKKIPYLPINDVDFSSAKCKYRKLTENSTATLSSFEPRRVPMPNQIETNNFFEAISQSKQKPAILSVVHPFNQSFKPKGSKLPPSLLSLYQEDNIGVNQDQLIENCQKITITISEEESEQIELATRKQASCKEWFEQRSGRITASKLRAACHTNLSKPSKSLIKGICYPEVHRFSTAATR